jgi:hypothetical protein
MTELEGATLGIAVTGAVLGIINTFQTWTRDRIRIEVVPKIYFPLRDGFLTVSAFDKHALLDPNWQLLQKHGEALCVQVSNRSFVPVTINEVGFITNTKIGRVVLLRPLDVSGSKLPHRLEQFSDTTIYGQQGGTIAEQLRHIKKAYCKTACGRTFYGNSPAVKDLVRRARLSL